MMRKSLLLATACCLAAGLAAPGLAAQSRDTLRLTLDDALDVAVGSNPTYRQANNNISLNGIEMRTTWLDQILPQASLSLFNTAFTGNLQRTAQDNFGNPIDDPDAAWNYFSSTNQNLNLSWSIRGQSLFQAHKRQTLTNQGRNIAEVRALTDLQVQVQRLYMDAVEQRDLLRVEEELLAAREIDLDVAERLFSLAFRTRVDVLNAELAVEQQAFELRQQRTRHERALLSLRTQLGNEEIGPISLDDSALPLFDPSGLDADNLARSALTVNPELLQSGVSVRSSMLGVKEANNAWWPTIDMGIDVYRRTQLPQGQSLFDVSFDEELESRFFMQFSIPMFNNYFQNKQSIERASVQLENDMEAERAARLRIEETVRGALLELSNQWESLRL
ncbi:MAG: TolC family protein, partial [Gemmatimonadetes bacterium]|nr:TolC family protein [Gemmatimonadota bacterium]